jgi:hypothetical protein
MKICSRSRVTCRQRGIANLINEYLHTSCEHERNTEKGNKSGGSGEVLRMRRRRVGGGIDDWEENKWEGRRKGKHVGKMKRKELEKDMHNKIEKWRGR